MIYNDFNNSVYVYIPAAINPQGRPEIATISIKIVLYLIDSLIPSCCAK